MNDIKMNAIFYSNGNIELAYSLKKSCRIIDCNVFNILQFTEFIYRLNDTATSIIFIDYDNVDNVKNVLEFIYNYKFNDTLSIVIISDNDVPELKKFDKNFYKISKNNLQNDLIQIETKLKYSSTLRKKIKCNINELAEKITKYLIDNGFSPQLKGFTYIKECILFAVVEIGKLGALHSEVYPYIANKYNTEIANIERNIRNAIEQANKLNFNNNDIYKLTINKKISNKFLIGLLVDKAFNMVVNNKMGA